RQRTIRITGPTLNTLRRNPLQRSKRGEFSEESALSNSSITPNQACLTLLSSTLLEQLAKLLHLCAASNKRRLPRNRIDARMHSVRNPATHDRHRNSQICRAIADFVEVPIQNSHGVELRAPHCESLCQGQRRFLVVRLESQQA